MFKHCSQRELHKFTCHQQYSRASSIQTLNNSEFSVTWTFPNPVYVITFHSDFNFHFLNYYWGEHVFICLVTILVFSFVKFLLKLLYILKLFLFYGFVRVLFVYSEYWCFDNDTYDKISKKLTAYFLILFLVYFGRSF